jgi:hypothetical protein
MQFCNELFVIKARISKIAGPGARQKVKPQKMKKAMRTFRGIMPGLISILIIITSILSFSCGGGTAGQKEPAVPRAAIQASVIAGTVIYDVIVRNPAPEDTWMEDCLRDLDREGLVNMVFEAIYRDELIAYDHLSHEPLTVADIKNLEKDAEFSRDHIGKIQFSEEWYFDQDNLRMEKRVNSMSFGYEVFDLSGNLRGYKPAFMVILN